MEGIGFILLIIFAIASKLNKQAMKKQAKKGKGGQVNQPAPKSSLEKAIRQIQEAAEKTAMGQEAPKPAAKARPKVDREKGKEDRKGLEPVFRGSIAERPVPMPSPLHAEKEALSLRAATSQPLSQPSRQARLPFMNADGLVQAVIAQEILNRPRSVRRPYRPDISGNRPGV